MISENQDLSFDDVSKRNTIDFYREELLKIEKGERATDHFNERQRKSLVKQGILVRVYGHGGCKLRLTEETKRIMA
ncbi:hypothetical protein DRO27_01410 [Candidatus Bathyarchaeota archaeon]|jgi:hypothetical protein|nr:MAG: hypothetical protein DRO27_01410 [Candidatus Bathyarchaeota archaeon]